MKAIHNYNKTLSDGYVVVVEKEKRNSPNNMETITMWAELSLSNVPDARAKTRPLDSTSKPANVDDANARTVIISSNDVAKIHNDAEKVIEKDKNFNFQRDNVYLRTPCGCVN